MPVRVLVVDDTDHVRRLLVDLLSLDGFDVVGAAADGEDAVTLTLLVEPDVVVMDLRMPRVDGITASRRIREHRPNQAIVLYTAYLDAAVQQAAHAAGVALCVGKAEGVERLERELSRIALGLVSDQAP